MFFTFTPQLRFIVCGEKAQFLTSFTITTLYYYISLNDVFIEMCMHVKGCSIC